MEGSVTSCVERNRQGEIILESLQDMRNKKEMLDASLACDDSTLNVHKLVLSACSSFLRKLISNNQDSHASICLPGVKSSLLAPLLDFMYAGEVFVAPEDLSEFLELAEELQVKGLTQIAPVDTVTTASSSTVYVDIKKLYQEGEVVHKNKDVEPSDAQKDINQNGVEKLSYDDVKQNIYVMETAILVDTIDKNVMNTEDENYSGTNIRIEVSELVMDGKQEDDNLNLLPNSLVSQDNKLNGTENEVQNDSQVPQYEAEEDTETTNKTYIEEENIKEQLNYITSTSSEENKVSSQQHLKIRSKIAKVGVREHRRHLCKVCGKSGNKDIIYNHIAMEHVNPITMEQEEKTGKEKIDEKIRQKVKAEKRHVEKDWKDNLLAEETSMASKTTASELAVDWGDEGDSSSVCEKEVTATLLVNPIAMEPANPIAAELAHDNAMDHINPIATELAHDNAMEHINPIDMELAHDNAMEHIYPIAMELAHQNSMKLINPLAMEPANPIAMKHANHKAIERRNPISTELVNPNIMEIFTPITMEPANPIDKELGNHNAMERYNPIAMEPANRTATENVNVIVTQYANPNTMELVTQNVNPKTDDQENVIIKGDSEGYSTDKMIVHVVEEKPEQPVPKNASPQTTEIKLKCEENEKANFQKKSIVPSQKRKTVTFSPNEPEEFIYEREEYEDTRHFKKKRIAPSDAAIVVNVNDMLKLRAGGILSVTKKGFQFQDEPQQIEDLDNIKQKTVCKKIVMLGRDKFKCMECGKKGQKSKMLNHINRGKFN